MATAIESSDKPRTGVAEATQVDPAHLRPIAFRLFTKKYNLSLRSDSLRELAEYVSRKAGSDWRSGAEALLDEVARIYKRTEQTNPIVSRDTLLPILHSLEVPHAPNRANTLARSSTALESLDTQRTARLLRAPEAVNPRDYLSVIDAFAMPRWRYDPVRRTFAVRRDEPPASLLGAVEGRVAMLCERFYLLKHRVLRHAVFQQHSLGTSSHRVHAIKDLLGRSGQSFILLGMLSRSPDGRVLLQDPDDCVSLDLSHCRLGSSGWFTFGLVVLADGVYQPDGSFRVMVLAHPPAETRHATLQAYGPVDFLGTHHDKAQALLLHRAERHVKARIVFAAEAGAGAAALCALEAMLAHYEQAQDVPLAIVLTGNFMPTPQGDSGDESLVRACREHWDALARVFARHPRVARGCELVFVPGPRDPWWGGGASCAPRKRVPEFFVSRVMRACGRAVFASNPCRLSYFSQDIVVSRDDMVERLQAQSIRSYCAAGGDETGYDGGKEAEAPTEELRQAEQFVRTLCGQAHLSPVPLHERPVMWEFDQALRLVPLPTVAVLAEPTMAPYACRHADMLAINPGPLCRNSRASWYEYHAAEGRAEALTAPLLDVAPGV